MRISPIQVLASYLLVVAVAAASYFYTPNAFEEPLSIWESLYFSVVTITTLGYGEITPANQLGQMIAAVEALCGVFLIGIFLMSLAQGITYRQERNRISVSVDNLRSQYLVWREDIAFSILALTNESSTIDPKTARRLATANELREYFANENNRYWYNFLNGLSSDNYYVKQIRADIEYLQQNVERFLSSVPIDDVEDLKILSSYCSHLNRMRRHDLDHTDDQKSFAGQLMDVLTFWNVMTGEYEEDYFLAVLDKLEQDIQQLNGSAWRS